MPTSPYVDPVSLKEQLRNSPDALAKLALEHILQLEKLCAMMTDTGVILEEDVQHLIKADTWWLPDEGEYCFTNLQEALEELEEAGVPVEWCRAHTLPNAWAVLYQEVRDSEGKVVIPTSVEEFSTYQAAEEAAAAYQLRRRRIEYDA